jgi:hypothetical protein
VPAWEETVYPVPAGALRITCLSCGSVVAGRRRGSRNVRSILKEIKSHDDVNHPPYDPDVIQSVTAAIRRLNDGTPAPVRAGRFDIDYLGSDSSSVKQQAVDRIGGAVEALVGVIDRFIVYNHELEEWVQDLEQWNDILTLQLRKANTDRERLGDDLQSALGDLENANLRIAELTGIRDTLQAQAGQPGWDRDRLIPASRLARRASHAFETLAITTIGSTAAGLAVFGLTQSASTPPAPPENFVQIVQDIDAHCDVLDAAIERQIPAAEED